MLCYLFLYLARNPDWLAKVRTEMETCLPAGFLDSGKVSGDNSSTILEALSKLVVLEACLKETLRLKPSAPLRSRETTEDVTLCGQRIPKGTIIG